MNLADRSESRRGPFDRFLRSGEILQKRNRLKEAAADSLSSDAVTLRGLKQYG